MSDELPINHAEAKELAEAKQLESNLARCYLNLAYRLDSALSRIEWFIAQLDIEQSAAKAAQDRLDSLRPLLKEVWQSHRDVDADDHNECEISECDWCAKTKAAVVERRAPIERCGAMFAHSPNYHCTLPNDHEGPHEMVYSGRADDGLWIPGRDGVG